MPRSSKPRKAYRPRVTIANAVEVACSRVRKLRRTDVQDQVHGMQHAFSQFTQGHDCATHWRSLTDTVNMAETLCRQGIGSGQQAHTVVTQAQAALSAVQLRRAAGGSWTLHATEHDALRWLISLHTVQLQSCDYREFEAAWQATHNRLAQARRGNGPRGAIVITGDIAP